MQKNKKWSENDTRRLRIAYTMGAKYTLMSQILNRSETSINKHMCRSGIRPLGTKRSSKFMCRFLTADMVWAEIKRQEKRHPLTSPSSCSKRGNPPVYMKSEKSRRLSIDDNIIYCLNLLKPIKYLAEIGYNIKEIHSKWANYLVNSKFFSSAQLLILANHRRSEKGLKTFIVAGLTH